MPMISREELDRLMRMAEHYIHPPEPRSGHQTIALYDELHASVMRNLKGLLEAADRGVGALMPAPERPSNDIVERLRAIDNTGDYLLGSIGPEAANDIVRLRADVSELRDIHRDSSHEIERLRAALKALVDDVLEYERVNNLSPNPGHQYCWQSVANACAILEEK